MKLDNLRPLTVLDIQRRIMELQCSGATLLPITDEEIEARRTIEQRRGYPYEDTEWREDAARLRAFFGILAEWSANA